MAGIDFDTATLIDMSIVVTGELQTGDPDHYYRVAPKANTDFIYVIIPDRQENLYLYDSTRTLITSTTSQNVPRLIMDASQSEYFIRVGLGTAGSYTMYVLASVNGTIDGYETTIGQTVETRNIETWNKLTPWGNMSEKTAPITSDKVKSSQSPKISYENNFQPISDIFNPVMVVTPTRQYAEPIRRDIQDHYRIEGTVNREGSAAEVLLRMYDRRTGILIDETWSDPAGQYSFTVRLHKDSKYYVIAFDDLENPDLQAVVHDALIPIAQ